MGKNLLLWLLIMAVLFAIFSNANLQSSNKQMLGYSEFIDKVQTGSVQAVTIDGVTITGMEQSGEAFETVIPLAVPDIKLMDELILNNVQVTAKKPEGRSIWVDLLLSILPVILIVGLFLFFMRQMQGGGGGRGGPMSFGKSKHRMLSEDQVKTTFADVAGCDEAKEDVTELVDFLKEPGKFSRLGGHIPKGVLMVGPPGTGKTLLARAVAGEAKVPFLTISGSDFVEMFVGVGASRVRDMFEQAKKSAPCIIFIDEIDAVGRHRGAGLGGGHDEREQTLNQLLVEMDGFEGTEGVIVVAATNRPDVLDPALLRPGRFDRQVVVGLPDILGREQILKVHVKKVPLDEDVKPDLIARGTPGFSGADLANLVNEAALFAARGNRRRVSMKEFELAKDKIMMGAERKSMVMKESEKLNTAWHEAGHAIVGLMSPEHDPVYKVSIIPRGRALGVTMFLPEEDKYSHSKTHLLSQICSLYGGRIAEEMHHGPGGVTTGASNDIMRATQIARNMVTKWGLSEAMGPILYDAEEGEVFLGKSAGSHSLNVSPETARHVDDEVRRIIDECYEIAEKILEDHRDKLEAMALALMKYETIERSQIDQIMKGEEPDPPKGWGEDSQDSDGSDGGASVEVVDTSVPPSSPDGHAGGQA